MKIAQFELERYFSEYEFNTDFLLCSSDCEALKLHELLEMADDEERQMWNSMSLGYTQPRGNDLLREEISKFYTECGFDDITVCAPEEGLFLIMNAVLESGDHVITVNPAYQSLQEIPRSMGCKMDFWNLRKSGREWYFDTDELEKIVKTNTKMIIVNFPHNPSGYMPDENTMKEIVDIARRNDIYILSDEMYYELFLGESKNRNVLSFCDMYEKAFTLFGMSKSFSLAGLRIGWIVSRCREHMKTLSVLKDYTTICSSALSEMAAIIALRNKEKILKGNVNLIESNIDHAKEFFSKRPDLFEWFEPSASSISFPKLNENIRIDEFCDSLVREKSVLLLPDTLFGLDWNHFRLGLGRKNFKQGLDKVGEFIREKYTV